MNNPDTNEQQEPRFRIPLWAWVVTIVALLFFALTLWQAQKMSRQLTELQVQMRGEQGRKETLETQRREMDQIRELLASPETQTVQLTPVSGLIPPLKIFWNDQHGLLATAQDVHPLSAGLGFQCWILPKKGNSISAGVFLPDANGTVLKLLKPSAPVLMKDAAELTVTIEPGNGSSQPTSVPVWSVRVP